MVKAWETLIRALFTYCVSGNIDAERDRLRPQPLFNHHPNSTHLRRAIEEGSGEKVDSTQKKA